MRAKLVFVALLLVSLSPATYATIINFDAQGLTGPSVFASASPIPQTLSITADGVTAVFTGGVILKNTSNLPADQTALYGTASFVGGMSNPLVVTFSQPIVNFFLDVFNGQTFNVQYRVFDNAGNSALFTLPPNTSGGTTLIGFPATGTIMNIEAVNPPTPFDFFIDNITFNQALPPALDNNAVPEPASLILLGTGLCALAFAARRAKRN